MNETRLDQDHREHLKDSASQLRGPARRAFQASIALKYCRGSPGQAEKLFGWGRQAVALGLNEMRTGIVCYSAHKAFSGNKLWEEKHPEMAEALRKLTQLESRAGTRVETQVEAQRKTSVGSGRKTGSRQHRLTAVEAIRYLRDQGFAEDQLPSVTTMYEVLKRNGCR